ncbi:MAG: hypothetical protein QF415_05090 [Candidatus Undinarchaeales archaeon]|jgi:hypothetical protein|nr:hypothetical protein [Candidatus Undinarchaeales archaeon]MDP7494541.1 hypothetical protein [Candidatus Undinarchaeales archaeon]
MARTTILLVMVLLLLSLTAAQVDNGTADVNATDLPANVTEPPTNTTDAPANVTEPPTNTTDAPANATEAPANDTGSADIWSQDLTTVTVDEVLYKVVLGPNDTVVRTATIRLANHLSEDLGPMNVSVMGADLAREAAGIREEKVALHTRELPFGPYSRHDLVYTAAAPQEAVYQEVFPYALEINGSRFDDFTWFIFKFDVETPGIHVVPGLNCSRRLCVLREKLPIGRSLITWASERPKLSMSRSMPDKIVQGEGFQVNFTLVNLGGQLVKVRLDEPTNPRLEYLGGALAPVYVPGVGNILSVNLTLGAGERKVVAYRTRAPATPGLKYIMHNEAVMNVDVDGSLYRGGQHRLEVLHPPHARRNVTLSLLSDGSGHAVLRLHEVEDMKAYGEADVLSANPDGVLSLVEWQMENATDSALLAPLNGTVHGNDIKVTPIEGMLVKEQIVTFTVPSILNRTKNAGEWRIRLPQGDDWLAMSLPDGMSFKEGMSFEGTLTSAPRRAYDIKCGDTLCLEVERARCCSDCGCINGFYCESNVCIPQACEELGTFQGIMNDNVRQEDGTCAVDVNRLRQRTLFLLILFSVTGSLMYVTIRFKLIEHARKFIWKRIMRQWVGF